MLFPFLSTQDGDGYQPVFTDIEELRVWGQEEGQNQYAIVMEVRTVFSLIRENDILKGLVVNPFTDNLILSREELEDLLLQA